MNFWQSSGDHTRGCEGLFGVRILFYDLYAVFEYCAGVMRQLYVDKIHNDEPRDELRDESSSRFSSRNFVAPICKQKRH